MADFQHLNGQIDATTYNEPLNRLQVTSNDITTFKHKLLMMVDNIFYLRASFYLNDLNVIVTV